MLRHSSELTQFVDKEAEWDPLKNKHLGMGQGCKNGSVLRVRLH